MFWLRWRHSIFKGWKRHPLSSSCLQSARALRRHNRIGGDTKGKPFLTLDGVCRGAKDTHTHTQRHTHAEHQVNQQNMDEFKSFLHTVFIDIRSYNGNVKVTPIKTTRRQLWSCWWRHEWTLTNHIRHFGRQDANTIVWWWRREAVEMSTLLSDHIRVKMVTNNTQHIAGDCYSWLRVGLGKNTDRPTEIDIFVNVKRSLLLMSVCVSNKIYTGARRERTSRNNNTNLVSLSSPPVDDRDSNQVGSFPFIFPSFIKRKKNRKRFQFENTKKCRHIRSSVGTVNKSW